jgi:dihydroorotase
MSIEKSLYVTSFHCGLLGDATVLAIEPAAVTLTDVVGETIEAGQQLACRGIVLGGRWWVG